MLTVLKRVGLEFNRAGIKWAVGASMMLYFHDLVESPRDLDLIVLPVDVEKADAILSSIGVKNETGKTTLYNSGFFYEYTIEGIEVDLMAKFRINLGSTYYEYKFNPKDLRFHNFNGVNLPLSPIEDWYLLYMLMNRDKKVELIEKYLKHHGIEKHFVLSEALEADIADPIKVCIRNLLNKFSK